MNLAGLINKELINKKVKIGRLGYKDFFEGILNYCDQQGNLHIITEDGFNVVIQQRDWGYVTDDFTLPKKKR